MKVFLALCLLLSLALAEPEAKGSYHPRRFGKSIGHHPYGHGPYGPGPYAYGHHAYHAYRPAPLIAHPKPIVKCHTVYDTTYTTKCKNVPERICKAVPVTKYRTEYEPKCHTVPEKVCHPVTIQVPDKECHTHPEKVCKDSYKTVYDTSYEEQCEDIEHKTCQESRVVGHAVHPAPAAIAVAPPPPIPVHAPIIEVRAHRDDGYYTKKAPHGLAFTGKRKYKREADASPRGKGRRARGKGRKAKSYHTPAPQCVVEIEHVCHKVPIKVARQVVVPRCTVLPKTECHPIVRDVVETKCHNEPREVCHKVPIKVPYTIPVETCKLVPNKICKKVPHKHPREVCATGYGYGHGHH